MWAICRETRLSARAITGTPLARGRAVVGVVAPWTRPRATMLAVAVLTLVLCPLAALASPADSLYPSIRDPASLQQPSYDAVPVGAAHESRTSASDGSYQYCSMPHPAVSFYQEPGAVKSGRVKAKLAGVLYVQRHQKRTAYHLFPHGEATRYDCDNGRPYLYFAGNHADAPAPVPVFAQTYTDQHNPLLRTFTNSTCQFPQLTLGGYLDGVQHGRELRELYGEKYGVLPKNPASASVFLRSSTAALTQQSASGVLRGLWPHHHQPLVLFQQADAVDTHAPSCDRASELLSAAKSTSAWHEHLHETRALREKLESLLWTNTSDWRADWDHYNDNFQARLCNGYPLPCALDDASRCVTRDEANQVFAAGDWEYNYYWVDRENVTEAIQLTSGLLIRDLIAQVQQIASPKSELQYAHLFLHDGDLGPLAGSLGIQTLRWPGMASNLAVEVWKTSRGKDYVRVLYSGSPLRSRHNDLDWMPLHKFVQLWRRYVPHDFVKQCATSL